MAGHARYLSLHDLRVSSLVDLPFGPDPAAVALGKALDYGQTDAGAGVFCAAAVSAWKDAVNFVGVTLIKADAVILDPLDGLVFLILTAYFNDRGLLRFGEFNGVGQQILQGLLKQGLIAKAQGQVANR